MLELAESGAVPGVAGGDQGHGGAGAVAGQRRRALHLLRAAARQGRTSEIAVPELDELDTDALERMTLLGGGARGATRRGRSPSTSRRPRSPRRPAIMLSPEEAARAGRARPRPRQASARAGDLEQVGSGAGD